MQCETVYIYYRAREMDALAQRPNLDTVTEESEEETSGKDKQGQSELHKLAAQEGKLVLKKRGGGCHVVMPF